MNRFLLVLVSMLLALPAAAKPIEDFHVAADGNDWAPAFERAQQCLGCTIELQPVTYPLARTVNVCSPLALHGQGTSFSLLGSRVTTARQTAFQTWSKKEKCPITGAMSQDGELEIEHLSIVQTAGLSKPGEVPFHGIAAHRRVVLFDVSIRGYVHGIDLTCDNASGSICSVSRFIAVDVDQSEHAGAYFQGADSNAHTTVGSRFDANCRQASVWNAQYIAPLCAKLPKHQVCVDPHLQCAGVLDLSFLGNSYVGLELATERQISPQVDYAGIVMAGANQFGSALGTYTEANTGYQWADAKATIVGGADTFGGAAGQLHGWNMTGLVITTPAYTFKLGLPTNVPNGVWSVGNTKTGPWPWGFKLDGTGAMIFDIGNRLTVGATPWTQP